MIPGRPSIDFVSFEDTEDRFEQDWIALKDIK